jgi:hypothetical protein
MGSTSEVDLLDLGFLDYIVPPQIYTKGAFEATSAEGGVDGRRCRGKSFTRLWVLAEVTLGKKTIVQLPAYGDYTVNGGLGSAGHHRWHGAESWWPHATLWRCDDPLSFNVPCIRHAHTDISPVDSSVPSDTSGCNSSYL